MTSAAQMIASQRKWFRWLGEESLSGGKIGLCEGGNYFPCGIKRPSQHSIMRWLGFDWDQVGLEHMVARITGMRNARPDERAEHAARRGGQGLGAVGGDRPPALPRAQGHLADRRPDG